jgi:phosphoribosylaminoimidazolecarboxamide formyltransferase/IMP cyclohydrolase
MEITQDYSSAEKIINIRYGENSHQNAALYSKENSISFTQLHGKELSYNNIVDMACAMNIVSEFTGIPAVSVIKHNNPCGAALGTTPQDAFAKALDCDPISAFGGIIACNETVNAEMAGAVKDIFTEVVISVDFTPEALDILKGKKNIRLIKINAGMSEYKNAQKIDTKETPFGVLVQDFDNIELNKDNFKAVTDKKPTSEQIEDMVFAWKIAKHVKSNAIVAAKDLRTYGLGIGQTSRIKSMELALEQACDNAKDAVIASDGFFPAVDNIQAAAQSRIAAIIQPGGSIKDPDVIAECNKYNIAMVFTGVRHFRH